MCLYVLTVYTSVFNLIHVVFKDTHMYSQAQIRDINLRRLSNFVGLKFYLIYIRGIDRDVGSPFI